MEINSKPENSKTHKGQSFFDNDDPDDLFQILMDALKTLWSNIRRLSTYALNELGGYQTIDKAIKWCANNPHLALILFAGGLVTVGPVLVVLGFGLMFAIITFVGFLLLEGTLLTFISMLLFICFGLLSMVAVFFVTIGVAAYFGFTQFTDLYGSLERYKNIFVSFLQPQKESTSQRNVSQTNKIDVVASG
ncbi:uncharacterized protein LOC119672376 [Teleopsis dalmanni]|uniref:uncharacterized protein LOC119672376 n=1 Tax=Teleopsis dalmanni TaxID=139649 RepID=UPI0018CFA91C|nr:uncharacterized protein LOC119672376 [Teleopsis dalmanni]